MYILLRLMGIIKVCQNEIACIRTGDDLLSIVTKVTTMVPVGTSFSKLFRVFMTYFGYPKLSYFDGEKVLQDVFIIIINFEIRSIILLVTSVPSSSFPASSGTQPRGVHLPFTSIHRNKLASPHKTKHSL